MVLEWSGFCVAFALLPESVTKDGKLTIGTNPSYAPAEFLDADGKTQIGYDMDLARALGNIFGLDTEIVSSNFDTIIPAIGTKYDLGIAAFTITKERMQSVDFVSYFTAGMGYAVAKGNPKNVNPDDLCGQECFYRKSPVPLQQQKLLSGIRTHRDQ